MEDFNPNTTEDLIDKTTRHEHEPYRLEGLPIYKCSGCKEFGGNVGYKCEFNDSSACHNFTLHEHCATLPDAFQHPLLGLLKFRPKTRLRHHCDACRDVMKGFVFEIESPDHHHIRLHPLCMLLPQTLQHTGHANHRLRLVMDGSKKDPYTCTVCRTQIQNGGWRYKCEEVMCQVIVDLSCAKINIYGLSVTRVAPISRGRVFISKLSTPAKWIAKTLAGVAVQVASGVIVNGMAG